jgi:hypothetical protein
MSDYPNVDWETFKAFLVDSKAALTATQIVAFDAYCKAHGVSHDEAVKFYEAALARAKKDLADSDWPRPK